MNNRPVNIMVNCHESRRVANQLSNKTNINEYFQFYLYSKSINLQIYIHVFTKNILTEKKVYDNSSIIWPPLVV